MSTIRVKRNKNVDLVFEGERIASVSSRVDERTRWQELAVYRVDGGGYVLEELACSTNAGEQDKRFVHRFSTAYAVMHKLRNQANADTRKEIVRRIGFFYTDLAIRLFEDLMDVDEEFNALRDSLYG